MLAGFRRDKEGRLWSADGRGRWTASRESPSGPAYAQGQPPAWPKIAVGPRQQRGGIAGILEHAVEDAAGRHPRHGEQRLRTGGDRGRINRLHVQGQRQNWCRRGLIRRPKHCLGGGAGTDSDG